MTTHYVLPDAGEEGAVHRPLDQRTMPLWRKRQVVAGVLRGLLWHAKGRPGRLPIIHADVMLRQYRGTIRLGNLVELHERVVLSAIGRQGAPAQVSVGDMTSIWYGTVISARREVTIGSHCAISWNCSIVDDDMHEILELRGVGNPIRGARPVHIEDHVWIGAGSTILKGVTIGRNAIIAAGAIVTHDVPPATLVAGAPARIIRDIAGWR